MNAAISPRLVSDARRHLMESRADSPDQRGQKIFDATLKLIGTDPNPDEAEVRDVATDLISKCWGLQPGHPAVESQIAKAIASAKAAGTSNGADRAADPQPSPPKPPPKATGADITDQFVRELEHAGIEAPRNLITDGKLRRCDAKADGKRGKGDASYLLYIGTTRAGHPYGVGGFQNWRSSDGWTPWKSYQRLELDEAERAEIKRKQQAARAAHEADKHKRRVEASARASAELAGASPVPDDHPYLMTKAVRAHGLKADGNAILVPMHDIDGLLHNRQKIGPDGTKRFLFGGRVDGCFHALGELAGDVLVIAEGFATAATIHEATELPVAIAFDSGNLPKVARAIRKRHPDAKIVIAGDDDWKTTKPDGTPHNPGRIKATEAAQAVDGVLVLPEFGPDRDDKQTDFNDLAAELGNGAVRSCLERAFKPPIAEPDGDSGDPLDRRAPPVGEEQGLRGVTLADFRAYMPLHTYIYVPSRDLWPAGSVNARVPPIPAIAADGTAVLDKDGKQKSISATAWLDRYKPVEQMTWAPGLPMLIQHRLISEGGWIEREDVTCFNRYRPPTIKLGDAAKAGPWREHVERIFKDDAEHIARWLAHRVQRPQDKINHALVLGGNQGIGKDTILEPVKHAIGPWNFAEISPQHLLGRFNSFLQSVIMRVNEARDLGDLNRFQFYDHMKSYAAAPPDVLRIDEKHLREYNILNCVGIIITTNHKADGIFLPADDRRHFVAWSDLAKEEFDESYWSRLWGWYAAGGNKHVAAFLAQLDISAFNPKAPPPKTPAFWDIVDANRSSEDAEFADVLEAMGDPAATTLDSITATAESVAGAANFTAWIKERKNRRLIPHRLETSGYVPVRNDGAKDGLWKIAGKRQVVYARSKLPQRERLAAAEKLL
jgi:phage/plasmid primase-like uncharacterized protein